MPLDILTIGDCSIDEYMKVDEASVICDIDHKNCKICFNYADKIPVEEFHSFVAGNACNTAVSFTAQGLNAAVYTELGDDPNSEKFLQTFKELGISTEFCRKNKGEETDVHTVIIYKGERTILSYHNVKKYKLLNWPKPNWIYYTSLSKGFETFQADLVTYLKENPEILVAFNPGTFQFKAGVESLLDVMKVTDVLFVNKEEAQELTNLNTNEIIKLHEALQKLGCKMTVITDGKNGASAHDGNNEFTEGIIKTKVIDKTGAGDAFAAGFISAMYYGKNVQEALKWGAINAAGVVTRVGAVRGVKTQKDIANVLKSNPEFSSYSM